MKEVDLDPEAWLAPQKPATEKTFVGREKVVEQLRKALYARLSAALLGRGGSGKTSTLRALQRDITARGGRSVAYVPVHDGDTAATATKRMAENLADAVAATADERASSIALAQRGELKEALEVLASRAPLGPKQGRPVVLLDDTHRLSSGDRADLWSSLNRVVDHQTVAVLISGRPPLWDEANAAASVCWHSLQPKLTLGAFSETETHALFQRAASLGMRIAQGSAAAAHAQTDGDPYALCHILYRHALTGHEVTPTSVVSIGSQPEVMDAVAARRGAEQPRPESYQRSLSSSPPLHLFLHFVASDADLAAALRAHLTSLKAQASLSHSMEFLPVSDTDGGIEGRIAAAQAILVLVSADYLASLSCQRQLVIALRHADARGVPVIPILARPAMWKTSPLGRHAALPTNERPVSRWKNRDEAWLNVVTGIESLLKRDQ